MVVIIKEVTDYLGASRESIFKWIESKDMPAHKLGKLWKFKISEVDEWIRSGRARVRDCEDNRQNLISKGDNNG
ncbi:transcriptional regulator [Clostridia bacterium]|nr:transcriptional regulator [Clostridia bacterium]